MIEARDLGKRFAAKDKPGTFIDAVKGVSFTAPDGAITGLLGPNGAGKTTTLRMIATLVRPSEGSAWVDGIEAQARPLEARARIGMLSDARGLYGRLTARENITYYGALHGLDGARIEAATAKLVDWLDMKPLLDRRVDGFSSGERMKV